MSDPATGSPAPRRRWHLRHRGTVLFLVLLATTLSYLAVLAGFDLIEDPHERIFGQDSSRPERVRLYIDPVTIDAPDDTMQVRIWLTPGVGMRGAVGNSFDRDITVNLINNDSLEQRVLRANEAVLPVTIPVDLTDGNVANYPLDSYTVDLRFQSHQGGPAKPGAAVPQEVTIWEHLLGFKVRTTMLPGDDLGDIRLRIDLRRADAQIFFALAAYLAMALVACNSLVISSMVFLHKRKVEATLTSALGALVFALPAMRNALPGAPPLGVQADLAVFLWAEIASVISLGLFVYSWARQK